MPASKLEKHLVSNMDKKELEEYEISLTCRGKSVDIGRDSVPSSSDRGMWGKDYQHKPLKPKASTYPRTGTITVDNQLEENVLKVLMEAGNLLMSKHNDYGSKNISDAPGGALNGLSVRLHDKVARLNNLLTSGKDPQHESLRDTFIDIVNYGIISLLVIDGKWDSNK